MAKGQIKHSLTLHGHRTSVTLEAEFWEAFREIANQRGMALNALATEIDAARGPDEGLASSMRRYCLAYYRRLAKRESASPEQG